MEPKLIKRGHLNDLILAEYSGKNESGFEPLNDIVLVLPDQVSEKTAGGIDLPPDVVERMQAAAESGVIIAMGDGAFRTSSYGSRPWKGYRPKPGDRVYMRRYSGILMGGEDKRIYRLVTDIEIGAVQPSSPGIFEGDPVVTVKAAEAA